MSNVEFKEYIDKMTRDFVDQAQKTIKALEKLSESDQRTIEIAAETSALIALHKASESSRKVFKNAPKR